MKLIDKYSVVAEIKDLYEDIDKCIGDLILARSKNDQRGISNAHWKMETLMVNTQQVLSYILQHLEVKEVQEESVSEDLGLYINELSKQFPEVSFAKLSRIAVRVAKWQKEHLLKLFDGNDLSKSVSEDLEEVSKKYSSCIYLEEVLSDDDKEVLKERLINNFKAGAKWQREQMQYGENLEAKKIEIDGKFECPNIEIKDAIEVSSRMKYIDEDLKPIAEFIMDYCSWNLHKDEWSQPTIEVPLFRVLDALAQRGKPYCFR